MARGNGRGRGRGRGGGNFRGRGRGGGFSGNHGAARGMPGSSFLEEELDFTLKMFADVPNGNGRSTPRGRGRGGPGRGSGPNSGSATPSRGRGRGNDFQPRGRGRGQPDYRPGGRRSDIGIGASPRGRGGGPFRRADTLSGLLYQERPLLRPIIFVPSVLTKVLFEENDDELLKPGVEDTNDAEQSHVPTADKVFRVFSGGNIPRLESESEDEDDVEKEEIEEVDFNDLDKLLDASETVKTTTVRKSIMDGATTVLEEQFTGFYFDPNPSSATGASRPPDSDADVDNLAKMVDETLSATDEVSALTDVIMSAPSEERTIAPSSASIPPSTGQGPVIADTHSNLFFVDTQPTPIPADKAPLPDLQPPALRDDDSDDVIVYVAPHPRKSEVAEHPQVELMPAEGDTSHFTPYVSQASLPSSVVAQAPASSSADATPAPQAGPSTISQAPAPPPSLSTFSFSFSQTPSKPAARLVVPPVSTPRQAKAWKKKRGVALGSKAKKQGKFFKSSFGTFGAMREEALLHGPDPRKAERRRGDSDLDWGDEEDYDDNASVDEVEEGLEGLMGRKDKQKEVNNGDVRIDLEVEVSQTTARLSSKDKGKAKALDVDNLLDGEVSAGHGMDVDSDLDQPDLDAMKRFASGLLGANAGTHVTMEDVDIEERIRKEDASDEEEDDNDGDSSLDEDEDDDEEDIVAAEEAMLISEALEFDDGSDEDEDEDDDSEDEDDDLTPRTSFQARLERLRQRARSKKAADTSVEAGGTGEGDEEEEEESDEDRFDFLNRHMTWAEQDDQFFQNIQDILDENEHVIHGRDRKMRKALFRSIQDGDFGDLDDFGMSPAKRKKDKMKDVPPELQAQWEKDRQKKAEYKKARAQARLEQAADPTSKKKGGKKGRKAMLAAAALDPTINVLPNRIIDLTTLVQQIRRFIADLGGPNSMSLPPTNKETRKNVHELAVAFGLKSVSKGKGDARYTTLSKTTRTGVKVDEWKIAKIVRRGGGMGARGDSFIYDKKGKGAPRGMPKQKEGDVVGQAAPKLSESNLGFRMLAMMGWAEGDRIGFTGGLEAPLTAIIKRSKLGLGATK
ncbi:hypothetical protein CVT26_002973 [Gymnopilus dilepis]|uniref:Protein SQS1 n=1 Tax=Gymnopilus dilepis TaxID=231916 RepID=A0A409Y4M6_9AGAR|nr:hypothetical protein CVT26_002973 [Gymnopilus dilepis]